MEADVQKKIDSVLGRIKDSQSGMTIAQMGLVQKIRHSEENRRLIVFMNHMGKSKACCSVLNMAILADLEKEMEVELKKEFPWFSVRFTDAQNA